MAMQTIEDLFDHELQDIYAAERSALDALEQMAHEGADRDIRRLYTQHRKETQAQIKRLERILRRRGLTPPAAACPGFDGLMREKKALLRARPSEDLLEFYNVGFAQKIERYEISAYEALIDLAEKLGFDTIVDRLAESLQEEEVALHRLKAVASEFEVASAIEMIDEEPLAARR